MRPWLTFALLIVSASLSAAERAAPILIEEIHARGFAGYLGLPLGTVCKIEAIVIDGDALRIKSTVGKYLLKVHSVDGKPLAKQPTMRFGGYSKLRETPPSNHTELYEQRLGKRLRSTNTEEMRKLERGYVGSTQRLLSTKQQGSKGLPKACRKIIRCRRTPAFPSVQIWPSSNDSRSSLYARQSLSVAGSRT